MLLGIDGGGTKTVAWLAPLDDPTNSVVLGRGQSGTGNPRAVGFEAAQSCISAAIDAAFADARLPRQPVASACFGLAGAGRAAEQERIAAWAKKMRLADAVLVTGDAEPVLAAAAETNVGIVLICGTGSLAWGRNHAGQVARCGGWGYLLGDEGSAYWIAKAGLTAAMRSADGREESTLLLSAFQDELRAAGTDELIEHVYSLKMTRERLAGLAHIVLEAAPVDPAASRIINEAAAGLAEMVNLLARRLELPSDYTLAMTGGVLLNEEVLRQRLLNLLNRLADRGAHTALIRDPVQGAVALARAAAQQSR
jgi:N-acetylglucosamine kinase-like BadF-type ATPase